jgi:hypothetical protein
MHHRALLVTALVLAALLGLAQLVPATAQPSEPRMYLPAVRDVRPTATSTPRVRAEEVRIVDILLHDAQAGENEELVQLFNASNRAIDLIGWRLINSSRADRPTYTFPRYTINPGDIVLLYTRRGQDNLEVGDFYWNRDGTVWSLGDVAEVRDAANHLIHSYVVVGNEPTATATRTATVTATPTRTSQVPTPTRDPTVCAAEYPTVCIAPPPPDLNCGDISFRRFRVLPPDRHGFDTDNDGIGCESG